MVQNRKNTEKISYLIIHFPISEGVSEVSAAEHTSKASRAVSERMKQKARRLLQSFALPCFTLSEYLFQNEQTEQRVPSGRSTYFSYPYLSRISLTTHEASSVTDNNRVL